MKEILIDDLIDIIGYNNELKNDSSFIRENREYFSETGKGKLKYNFDEYINRVQDKAKEMEIDDCITVDQSNILEESRIIPLAKIEIKNLKIKFLNLKPLSLSPFSHHGKNGEVCIYFKNIKFISSRGIIPSTFSVKDTLHAIFFIHNEFDDFNLQIANSNVRIENNRLTSLIIDAHVDMHLGSRNFIEYLDIALNYKKLSYIYFSPYQQIDTSGRYAYHHRDLFLKLQKAALDRHDFPQVKVFQIEIMKCEHHFLHQEKPSLNNLQDKVIMSWSYHVSHYGTSWILPLWWLLAMNFICSMFIYHYHLDMFDWEEFRIMFFNLLNPLTKPDELLGKNTDPTSFLLLMYTFQKAFYVALLYEIIKAFRRFAIK